ncbi:endo alpha-1,4 polygalactosaminidase [Streptomyces sp. NPDC005931]|uniref:endo alpha-1,4 polygalactosaminidase n=1 Tax=Streptomyces sp. NPDC005931 TaxID=3364737 RepID=UPI0036A7E95A
MSRTTPRRTTLLPGPDVLTVPATVLTVLATTLTGCSAPDGGASADRPPARARTSPAAPPTGSGAAPSAPRTSPSPPRTRPAPTRTPSARGGTRWRPRPGLAWQWQLDGRVEPSADVPVYDIDGFENTAADVARLHREGRKVICYVNVGAWEDFRPDRDAFPRSVLGRTNGWEGERWLDIRRISVLGPIMERRFDMCRDKGFDAVEPDLMEGYGNDTGFPLTAADQLRYNRMIARLAHERGMSVGLKNDLPQIPQLVDDFDFAVNEECAQYGECAELTPFVEAGKAVFHVEYAEPAGEFCAASRRLKLSSMRKKPELGVWRDPC